ncbi:MAG: hypothetical protein IIX25_04475, partial [Clostridia bacterium]|nr:hypothetical protein [Clostridia bacterium]
SFVPRDEEPSKSERSEILQGLRHAKQTPFANLSANMGSESLCPSQKILHDSAGFFYYKG